MKRMLLLALLALVVTPALAANTPDHSTWLKPEARGQLRAGMTQEEAKAVLGEASRTRFTKGPGGSTSELEYRSEDQRDWMSLFFLEGRFTHYSIARLGTGEEAQADRPWLAPTAWAKLSPGMSLQEVEDLLGKPPAKSYAGGTDGVSETVSAWLYDMTPAGTDPATGMVMILNDKVLSITSPLFPVN